MFPYTISVYIICSKRTYTKLQYWSLLNQYYRSWLCAIHLVSSIWFQCAYIVNIVGEMNGRLRIFIENLLTILYRICTVKLRRLCVCVCEFVSILWGTVFVYFRCCSVNSYCHSYCFSRQLVHNLYPNFFQVLLLLYAPNKIVNQILAFSSHFLNCVMLYPPHTHYSDVYITILY